jgi:hypothetical protein
MNSLLSFCEGLVHTNLLTCRTIAMLLRRIVHRNIPCNRVSTYYISQRNFQSLNWITGKHYYMLKVYSACFHYILGSRKFWKKCVQNVHLLSLNSKSITDGNAGDNYSHSGTVTPRRQNKAMINYLTAESTAVRVQNCPLSRPNAPTELPHWLQ